MAEGAPVNHPSLLPPPSAAARSLAAAAELSAADGERSIVSSLSVGCYLLLCATAPVTMLWQIGEIGLLGGIAQYGSSHQLALHLSVSE